MVHNKTAVLPTPHVFLKDGVLGCHRTTYWSILGIIALGLPLWGTNSKGQDGHNPTIDDLISALGAAETTFLSQPSIFVEFLHERQYVPDQQGVAPTYIPRQIIFARKGSSVIAKAWNTTGAPETDWCSWKDDVGVERHVQALMIYPEAPPDLLNLNHYFGCQFLDIFKGLSATSTILKSRTPSGSLSGALQTTNLPLSIESSRSDWEVLGGTERIEGHDCVVITHKGLDTLWLDKDCGYACRKRELKNAKGELLRTWLSRDFQQVLRAFWLPKEQTRAFYDNLEVDPLIAGKLRLRETNRLIKVSFSPLPDSFFDIPIPDENGFVVDLVRNMQYELIPHDMTDKEIRNRALVKAARLIRAAQPWQPGIAAWGLLGMAMLASMVPYFWKWRK